MSDSASLRPVHLALAAAAVALVGLLALTPVPVVDLWWQMKTGQLIWEAGRVPRADPFSHTAAGAPWIVQEWLPALLFYHLYQSLSPLALVWFKIVGAVLAFGLLFWRCLRRTDRPLLAAALTLLAAAAARTFLDIRPQLFSYVLFVAILALLEEHRRTSGLRHRLLLPIPPLMLLWANLHAGFLLGFLALGVHLVGEAWEAAAGDRGRWVNVRALGLVIAVSAPLTLLQPNGTALWRYPFLLMGHDAVMEFILEWRSPNFHQAWTRPYEALLLLTLATLALARRRLGAGDLLLFLILCHASLTSIRHIPIFALAVTPIVAEALATVVARGEAWLAAAGRLAAATVAATAAAALLLAYGAAVELQRTPRRGWFEYTGVMRSFPVAACDAIEEHGWEGALLNDYKWGGYLIWRFHPHRNVFIDGRAEVYFGAPFDDYHALHHVFPGWQERLDRWRIATVLLERNSYLARVMAVSPSWTRVYEDGVAVIFRRRSPAFSSRRASRDSGVGSVE